MQPHLSADSNPSAVHLPSLSMTELAACISETSVATYQITWRHNPETTAILTLDVTCPEWLEDTPVSWYSGAPNQCPRPIYVITFVTWLYVSRRGNWALVQVVVTSVCIRLSAVAYPGIFFVGGSTNSVEDRGRRGRGSGGGSPLVRGSGGSCNLVQEISFHIVKFSQFLVLQTIYDDNQFICHC